MWGSNPCWAVHNQIKDPRKSVQRITGAREITTPLEGRRCCFLARTRFPLKRWGGRALKADQPLHPLRVYVAGPMSQGDLMLHVREAALAGKAILDAGGIPFLPQVCAFWHMVTPADYETWLAYDMEWLRACDVLLRLPGESEGADREVAQAKRWGIRVTADLTAVCATAQLRQDRIYIQQGLA